MRQFPELVENKQVANLCEPQSAYWKMTQGKVRYVHVASLDETEMISYDTQCASAATADTLK